LLSLRLSLFFYSSRDHPDLPSFPTRRSSDLGGHRARRRLAHVEDAPLHLSRLPRAQGRERPDREGDRAAEGPVGDQPSEDRGAQDRKSTRLNSSHSQISYAVFCLKKKKTQKK